MVNLRFKIPWFCVSQIIQIQYNSNSIGKDLKMSMTEDSKRKTNGRWTREEHQKFMLGLELYGKNWKKIQSLIVTRNGSQIRSHAQKFFLKMGGGVSVADQNAENIEPSKEQSEPEGIKQEKKLKYKIPEINSPIFWSQISQLIKKPAFTFWELIDEPIFHGEDTRLQKIESFNCSQSQYPQALSNITLKMESTSNTPFGFNICPHRPF